MSIYRAAPVELEPVVFLAAWRVFEASLCGQPPTRHLCGRQMPSRGGRASTAIEEINSVDRTVRTRSGRLYALLGNSGHNSDALYVWETWSSMNDAKDIRDVTDEIEALLVHADGSGDRK